MKLSDKKTVLIIIIVNVVLVLGVICGKILTRFDYEDHLDDTVITVDNESITLREFGYYIYKIEDFVHEQAIIYDPENPKHWWNTHFSAGLDSQFVSDYAKNVAVKSCICDQIYYKEALAGGSELDEAEKAGALAESKELVIKMTKQQLEATGLNEVIINKMNMKHATASKYAEGLIETRDFSRYSKDPKELLNWDGEYYREEILPKHKVELNDKLLSKIVLGQITVNNDD